MATMEAQYINEPTLNIGDIVTLRVNEKGELIVASSGGGGDASAAKQDQQTALLTTIDADTGNIATSTSSIDGKFTTLNAKDFATETTLSSLNGKVTACNTGAVVISSSALPSGAATSAKQDTLIAKFAGAPSLFRNAGANATLNVKASAGTLISFSCYNTNAAARFIQIWDSATTAGSGTLKISKLVPANSETVIGADYLSAAGLACSSGIAFGYSTTRDTYTAATAGEQSTEVLYI